MKKRILDDIPTKSARRQQKKRPRMRVHGAALKRDNSHAGKKISSK